MLAVLLVHILRLNVNDLLLPNPALGMITSVRGARMSASQVWALDKACLGWFIVVCYLSMTLFPSFHSMETHIAFAPPFPSLHFLRSGGSDLTFATVSFVNIETIPFIKQHVTDSVPCFVLVRIQ